MRITADTNVLVRAVANDDAVQSPLAQKALREADEVIVTLPCLCEVTWVLSSRFKTPRREIAALLRQFVLGAPHFRFNRAAVEAGLALLEAGGDFADGVIAHEGFAASSERFVTFDKHAPALLAQQNLPTTLL